MREEGYYWVRHGDALPEVGCWTGGKWWLTGNDVPFEDGQLQVLGEKLDPPAPPGRHGSPCKPVAGLWLTIPWDVVEQLRQARLDRDPLTIELPSEHTRLHAQQAGVRLQWRQDLDAPFPFAAPDRFY